MSTHRIYLRDRNNQANITSQFYWESAGSNSYRLKQKIPYIGEDEPTTSSSLTIRGTDYVATNITYDSANDVVSVTTARLSDIISAKFRDIWGNEINLTDSRQDVLLTPQNGVFSPYAFYSGITTQEVYTYSRVTDGVLTTTKAIVSLILKFGGKCSNSSGLQISYADVDSPIITSIPQCASNQIGFTNFDSSNYSQGISSIYTNPSIPSAPSGCSWSLNGNHFYLRTSQSIICSPTDSYWDINARNNYTVPAYARLHFDGYRE